MLPSTSFAFVLPQGCSFDAPRSVLVDAVADAPEVLVLPDITLAWVAPDFPEPYAAGTTIPVPVYQVRRCAGCVLHCSDLPRVHPAFASATLQGLDRERLVVEFTVPVAGDKARFILAGCAMFLEAS